MSGCSKSVTSSASYTLGEIVRYNTISDSDNDVDEGDDREERNDDGNTGSSGSGDDNDISTTTEPPPRKRARKEKQQPKQHKKLSREEGGGEQQQSPSTTTSSPITSTNVNIHGEICGTSELDESSENVDKTSLQSQQSKGSSCGEGGGGGCDVFKVPKRRQKNTKVLEISHPANGEEKQVDEVSKKSSKRGGKKGETSVLQFIENVLPALRKEMSKHKKSTFKISDYNEYFLPSSKVRPTYILPLFHFLNKNEIVCSRYGVFEGKHMVKTMDGFNHTLLISKYADSSSTALSSDDISYLMKRFGREWYKIPAKDAHRVSGAVKMGYSGYFKIMLVGVFEDSFFDVESGQEVRTINPILQFEGLKHPQHQQQQTSSSPQQQMSSSAETSSSSSSRKRKHGSVDNNSNSTTTTTIIPPTTTTVSA